jgi:hypothetical protein
MLAKEKVVSENGELRKAATDCQHFVYQLEKTKA